MNERNAKDMRDTNLVNALREHAEWAQANEWETPITLGDDLVEAADRIANQNTKYTAQSVILKVAYIANPNLSSKSGTGGLTMAEYIKREALIAKLKQMKLGEHGLVERLFADGVYAVIAAFPAADVAPVVHGRWEYDLPTINTYSKLRCSICNWWTLDPSVDCSYNYCPNCGAKMDGGADHEAD